MKKVKKAIFTMAALIALAGMALTTGCEQKGGTGGGTGGTTNGGSTGGTGTTGGTGGPTGGATGGGMGQYTSNR